MRPYWKRCPAWLRPSATGMIVFDLLIVLQAFLGTSSGSGMAGPGALYETTASWSSMVRPTNTTAWVSGP